MKLVQNSLAMISFSSNKINILQHIKHLFSTIALAPGALGGMNTVYNYMQSMYCLLLENDRTEFDFIRLVPFLWIVCRVSLSHFPLYFLIELS